MQLVTEKLKGKRLRQSTSENYLAIWRLFNRFVLRLDKKPNLWEDRIILFCAHLVDNGNQSSTVKSYISAIKSTLQDDGYYLNLDSILIKALTRACRLENDVVKCRLPIQVGLLELMLFEIKRSYGTSQPYLETLYLALFVLAYYGLLRISEVAEGPHTLKAKDIKVAEHGKKKLLVLYSSKSHGKDRHSQKIKIEGLSSQRHFHSHRFFCPFQLTKNYLQVRGDYILDSDQLFIFRDRLNVQQHHIRKVLRDTLTSLGLEASMYGFHSLQAGRTVDLAKCHVPLQEICKIGRWRSNAVYRYLKK